MAGVLLGPFWAISPAVDAPTIGISDPNFSAAMAVISS